MRAGNMKLLTVSAVVILLVLIFSFVQYGGSDDSDSSGYRGDIGLGDSYTQHYIETANGSVAEYDITFRIVVIVGDSYGTQVIFDDEVGSVAWLTKEEFLGQNDYDFTEAGTETIATAFGAKDCVVYTASVDGYEVKCWICDEVSYLNEISSGTFTQRVELTSCTLFDPEPPTFAEGDPVTGVEAGDWMSLETTIVYEDGTVVKHEASQTVISVEGEAVTVTEVSDQGTTESTLPLDVFLTGIVMDDAEAIGSAILSYDGKTVLCEIYSYMDESGAEIRAYISNGMGYMIESVYQGITGVQVMTDTSLLG